MWHESATEPQRRQAETTDIVFRITCATLPVDHASILSATVCELLPWLAQSAHAGVHPIHVAGSQNGWERPDMDSEGLLILSRRTRLKIRVRSIEAAKVVEELSGKTLSLQGHSLQIISGHLKPIEPAATLFSRYAWYSGSQTDDEAHFVEQVIAECRGIGFSPNKILCGRSHQIAHNNELLLTRSVLLADVPVEHSINLQEKGLGSLRLIGCGLLIPHKDTGAVDGH